MSIANETLSADQQAAVETIHRWMDGALGQELTLGGYAGTGKTTILKHMWPELLARHAQVMTPTGKAAQVLRSKGISQACTIHSLIYHFRGVVETEQGTETPVFDGRDDGDWGVDQSPQLLVCDEASMVNESIYSDVMDRGLPVLWVGDHGQLPPVGGDPGLMSNPAIRLEQIHRQAQDNPILQLAHHVREGGSPDRSFSDGDRLKIGGVRDDERVIDYAIANRIRQVIVGTNRLRHRLNEIARSRLGYKGRLAEGDRLICTFNNRGKGVWNGQIFKVESITEELESSYVCDLLPEMPNGWGQPRQAIKVQKISLGNPEYRNADRLEGCCEFDYGYAITCHKSQGSEWDRVMVVDRHVPMFDMDRWRYTAFTRARDHLSVVLR